MEKWHVVGQLVVCEHEDGTFEDRDQLEAGRIYEIARVWQSQKTESVMFALKEKRKKFGYISDRFRPVRPTSIAAFERYLKDGQEDA